MTVHDIIDACEYCSCDVLDFYGNEIEITQENCKKIHSLTVESLSAKNNRVKIWTFVGMP